MVTINKDYVFKANQGSSKRATGQMIVFHSTANLNASAKNNAIYEDNNWDGGDRGPDYAAYVHFIAGDGIVYQVGEPGYVAWGAGATANAIAPVQIEMEESSDTAKQLRIYNTVIALIREMATKYGVALTFEANSYTGVQTHRHLAQMNHETDHTDPWAALARIGKTQAQVAVDIAHGAGKVVVATPAPSASAKLTAKKPAANVVITYELHQKGAGWLGAVTNFNNSNSVGFAGNPNHEHDAMTVRVNHGSVKYRVHVLGGGWLSFVDGSNKSDPNNGYAGLMGHTIDGVEVYYITPAGEVPLQAWYRSQTVKRSGYLSVVCDDGASIAGYTDSYAGMLGEALDRLQLFVGTSNPY